MINLGMGMGIALFYFFAVCQVALFFFIIRLVLSFFFRAVSDEMKRYPRIHGVWACMAIVGILAYVFPQITVMGLRSSIPRKQQLKLLEERLAVAGGWEAVKNDSLKLMDDFKDEGFYWHRGKTNALPPAINALKPMRVTYHLSGFQTGSNPPLLEIRLFGMPSTGGQAIPYFAVEVLHTTNTDSYQPKPREGVAGNRSSQFEKVAEGVFTIY